MQQLRGWQEMSLSNWGYADRWMLEATPGAGKTTFALEAARRMLEQGGKCTEIVFVVPSLNLVTQVCDAARDRGLRLQPTNNAQHNGKPVRNSQGQVVTYQQVASQPHAFARHAHKSFVIFDEAHHLGGTEDSSWGPKMRAAFDRAPAMLLMTGTPWREDNSKIPFVEYDKDGMLLVDDSYGMKAAWADDPSPIRNLAFPYWDATAGWGYRDNTGITSVQQKASEAEKANEYKVLDSLYRPDGDWFKEAFKHSNELLIAARSRQSDAAALLIAESIWHAEAYVDLIGSWGVDAELVHSETNDPQRTLAAFRDGDRPWLVSVKMVTEGVDLPRLEVLLYASKALTALAIRQGVGRPIRKRTPSDNAVAQIVFPDTITFRTIAAEIDLERRHAVKEIEEKTTAALREGVELSEFFVSPAIDAVQSETLLKGKHVDSAVQAFVDSGNGLNELPLEQRIQALHLALQQAESIAEPVKQQLTVGERKQKREANTRLAQKFHHDQHMNRGISVAIVWWTINKYFGHVDRADRSDEDLDVEHALLHNWYWNNVEPSENYVIHS